VPVSIISRQSQQIFFPGGTLPSSSPALPPVATTVTVETGVVVFAFLGTNPHDWTRDTLSFPVGPAIPPADFVNGIAAAAPTSFFTPMKNVQALGTTQIPVFLSGSDSAGDAVNLTGAIDVPGSLIPPQVGFAIDSAQVAHSAQVGGATLTLALAVFGNNAEMQRASYTAYVVSKSGGSGNPLP
jgi:hypothetical protein